MLLYSVTRDICYIENYEKNWGTRKRPLSPRSHLIVIRAGVTKSIRRYVTVNLCECPRMSAYRRISNPRICEYLYEL